MRTRRTPKRRPAPVHVERVERRRLLSAVLAGGVLTVTGTAGDDAVSVTYATGPAVARPGVSVSVNGQAQLFDRAAALTVQRIVVNAGGGNDTVAVTNRDAAGDAAPTVSVTGGDGADQVDYVGDARVTVNGGNGNDRLSVAADVSALYATVTGDTGDDTLTAAAAGGPTGRTYAGLTGGAGADTFQNLDNVSNAIYAAGGTGVDTVALTAGATSQTEQGVSLNGPLVALASPEQAASGGNAYGAGNDVWMSIWDGAVKSLSLSHSQNGIVILAILASPDQL